MRKNNVSPKRCAEEWDRIIKEIVRRRYAAGKDKKPKGSARITLAFARHPKIVDIAKEIINADLPEE